MVHECVQKQVIRDLEIKVAEVKSEQKNAEKDIDVIFKKLDKINWWIISVLATTVTILITIVLKK